MIKDLSEIRPIAEYLKRINAEPRSFTRAVVTMKIGRYWKDIHSITFTKEGIVVAPKDLQPTDREQDDIKEAWEKANIPTCIPASDLSKLPSVVKKNKNIYQFMALNCEEILMIQSRLDIRKSGEKKYVPWTFWSDGEWRSIEPDGKLPLFGLDMLADNEIVFIHEGAKSASYARSISEGTIPHPFADELKFAAHLGWIGGALNPKRTDWSPLRDKGVKRAYIVADNDEPGRTSIVPISKQLRCTTMSLQFTSEFPPGFDLADDFPKNMFIKHENVKHYNGPKFKELLHPSTWMTDKIPQEKGRPLTVLRECAKDLWAYVEKTDQIICKELPSIALRAEIANKVLAPYSDLDNTAKHIIKNQRGRTADIAYRPDIPGRIVTSRGHSAINIHAPSHIRAIEGDPGIFLKFLEYMFPVEEEREHIKRWIATLIARPDLRMGWGLLLISRKHGIGKTTLGECILAPLVGLENVSFPSESSFESSFNSWAAHKRLVIANEIYQGRSWKVYNMLKSIMTDKTIEVNIKHVPTYSIDNWCHVFACSNSKQALSLDEYDRRWFVPEMPNKLWNKEGYRELRHWLDGIGLSIVRHWATEFGKYVTEDEHSPMTDSKKELIYENKSNIEKGAAEFAEKYANSDKPGAIGNYDLYDHIRAPLDHKKEKVFAKEGAVKEELEAYGFRCMPRKIMFFNGRKQYVLVNKSLMNLIREHGTHKDVVRGLATDHLISLEQSM